MKLIEYNIVPICFLSLAAFLAWMQKDYYGWCIFLAFLTYWIPGNPMDNKNTKA